MRHPLEKTHSGRPRTSMFSRYIGGYYMLGLHDSRLRVAFRPTAIDPDGKLSGKTHMTIYQRP